MHNLSQKVVVAVERAGKLGNAMDSSSATRQVLTCTFDIGTPKVCNMFEINIICCVSAVIISTAAASDPSQARAASFKDRSHGSCLWAMQSMGQEGS